jgi:K+:H+ antiporter
MAHDFPLLINITAALFAAFVGGLIARRLKLPTIIGYLLAGVAIGPFTPGFIGNLVTIQELAELGIIFLMFGVGLHFSLRDLWAVRDTAVPGALLQMILMTLIGIFLARWWGWSTAAGVLLGLSISIASTVVLLRNLMDAGLLNTMHGKVAVGWLIMEDLATVLILVLLPAFTTHSSDPFWLTAGMALLKAVAFAALMLLAGTRVIPWLLLRVAHLRSRELFIVAIVVLTVGTAVVASTFFGVSLALGAFLAGVVVSESALSHQVGAEVLPFRETFAVLFFVSIGMLVDPLYLLGHLGALIALVAAIILGKALVTLLLGLFFPRPARTMLVIAAGLSQIGEFSFLLGQAGVALSVLTREQYSLLLAGALISITLNPFLFRALPWIETQLPRFSALWGLLNRHGPVQMPIAETLHNHVVVVGYGRVGQHIVDVLCHLSIPHIVVESDAVRFTDLERRGISILYGDAANSEILSHVHLEQARLVVVTLPDEAAALSVVATVRAMSPHLPIVARASTAESTQRLYLLGAHQVIYPELEGGLEIMRETLMSLNYGESDVQRYTDVVRRDHYNFSISTEDEHQALERMNTARQDILNAEPGKTTIG